MAPSDSGIANKHRRRRYLAAGSFHHLLHRMRLANIGFVERPGSTGCHHLRDCALSRRLVSMVMDPDRPAGRRKGQADRTTDPPGRTGHKHRISLVCLVHLVALIYLVCLVYLVYLVYLVKQDKPDRPDRPNRPVIMGGISHEGKPAWATNRPETRSSFKSFKLQVSSFNFLELVS
jgi:hypothetical protein